MVLDRLLNSQVGIVLISIIWGLGLSTLFAHACRHRPCYIITGPPIKNTMSKYFNYGTEKCYQYYPIISKCT